VGVVHDEGISGLESDGRVDGRFVRNIYATRETGWEVVVVPRGGSTMSFLCVDILTTWILEREWVGGK
jgi:hypothetical protein